MCRRGISLLELIVVIGIVAIMIGLLVPAVVKVRQAAQLTQSRNNLRQMILGLHEASGRYGGFGGGYIKADPSDIAENNRLMSDQSTMQGNPHVLVFEQLEGGLPRPGQHLTTERKYFLSPGDPSARPENFRKAINGSTGEYVYLYGGPTSYAFNMVAFLGPVRFPTGVSDGSSHTIALCEKYYQCFSHRVNFEGHDEDTLPRSLLMFSTSDPAYCDLVPGVLNNLGERRPSFADAGWGDVVPITSGDPPVSRPSVPGRTFQVCPQPLEAEMSMPQTPFPSGLPVAMFDGSVKVISPAVSPEVFWGAVTASGGEAASID